MPTVKVNGQTIFYETLGDGQPLLLLHGWAQIGRNLTRLAEGLAINYQVLLPDLPGYGQSIPPFRAFPVDFYQRDVAMMAGFLDALGLSNVHVMGFSDGGEVALLISTLRPDLCRSVVAWGAVGAFAPELCDYVQQTVVPMPISDGLRKLHPSQNVSAWPKQWSEAFCGIIAAGGDVSLSRASHVQCPLLLMLGDQDSLNPVADGQRFIDAASQPGNPAGSPARVFEVFKHAGHFLQDEQPERFLRVVRDFLRQHS
jgi:pimeloyl-ACP methyl ester carboxylesterase